MTPDDASRLAECKGSGAHCETHKQAFRWCADFYRQEARRAMEAREAMTKVAAKEKERADEQEKLRGADNDRHLKALMEEQKRADKAEAVYDTAALDIAALKQRAERAEAALKPERERGDRAMEEWNREANRLVKERDAAREGVAKAIEMRSETLKLLEAARADCTAMAAKARGYWSDLKKARAEADALRAALERVVDDCPSGPAFCIFPVHQIARAALAGSAKATGAPKGDGKESTSQSPGSSPAAARPAKQECGCPGEWAHFGQPEARHEWNCKWVHGEPAPAPPEACPGGIGCACPVCAALRLTLFGPACPSRGR